MRLSRRVWLACAGSALGAAALPFRAPADPSPAPTFDPAATFSPAALKDDLQWLADTLVQVGAQPFAYTDRAAWMARRDAALASLTEPLTIWQYWLRAAGPLFSSLNDGHADVSIFSAYKRARSQGARAFPLVLRWSELGLFVDLRSLESVPPGTQILAIDGVPAADLAKGVAAVRGAQSPSLRLFFAANVLPLYLYAQDPSRTRFDVSMRLPNGTVETQRLDAMDRPRLIQAIQSFGARDQPNYTFTRLKDGRVGYIDYRSCEDMDAFERFLHATFSSIRAEPVDGLVIDIRSNTGGDSSLNDRLWNMVTAKPFSQYGPSEERVSDLLKRSYGRKKYVQIYGEKAWSKPDETLISWDADPLFKPGPNPLRYSGPVSLLVGTGTFSSGMMCAIPACDFGLATIVGQETGEPVNSTGEIFFGTTQATGITYQFTTKFFYGPKPRPNMQGVLPDVTIVPTEADVQAGRDPVLDYALKAILQPNG
jgi:hypothetical protein